jgi:hypothetical protein
MGGGGGGGCGGYGGEIFNCASALGGGGGGGAGNRGGAFIKLLASNVLNITGRINVSGEASLSGDGQVGGDITWDGFCTSALQGGEGGLPNATGTSQPGNGGTSFNYETAGVQKEDMEEEEAYYCPAQ